MAGKNLLEDFVAQLNANVFFAEFAFSATELRVPDTGQQVELADHLVLLGDVGLLFQLKERDAAASQEPGALEAWFANKVRKQAVKQLRATRAMLDAFRGHLLRNQRGHEVPVQLHADAQTVAVVIYRSPADVVFRADRYCDSRSAGFVHILRDVDYFGVCQYLVTPAEVIEYLDFRRRALTGRDPSDPTISEAALVGQFIGGDLAAPPAKKYEHVLRAFRDDLDEWDISFLTANLGSRIAYREGDESETSHYRILAEFARLSRSELREFKKRLRLALEAVLHDRLELPYRLASPRTGCGFLILPVPSELHDSARQALHNYAIASKHEYQVERHVALSIIRRSPHVDIEWMYVHGPNGPNPELDALLARDYPFRRSVERPMPRYFLDADTMRRDVESG